MARTPKRQTAYQRRIGRGLARGLTRSQARGHPRPSEAPLRPRRSGYLSDKEAKALRAFRAKGNATAAAKSAGISPERFRRFLRAEGVAERSGRKWSITDKLVRETDMITGGRWKRVRVRGFDTASAIARHRAAVDDFLDSRDPAVLAPFEGRSITDTAGRKHVFTTNPNALLSLMTTGGETYEVVYKVVV